MPLMRCYLCHRIFSAAGARICGECQRKLDELYVDVRNYLRDNPDIDFNVETLADALDTDVRYIQGLVDLGYIERNIPGVAEAATSSGRDRLVRELERTLGKMRSDAATLERRRNSAATYGQELYGNKDKPDKRK